MNIEALLARTDRLPESFRQIRNSIRRAANIAQVDPEMALVRLRTTLESVLRDIMQRASPGRNLGTITLDPLMNQLRRDGHLPEYVFALGTNVKNFGNLGAHPNDSPANQDYVAQSLSNLL